MFLEEKTLKNLKNSRNLEKFRASPWGWNDGENNCGQAERLARSGVP